ncbi:glycoside hydrolase family 51 protein [Guyanagaster necrorhizus]|uniref:non-reducing end alpha-L-arabinofuranosidase n=1 Tax=Guyanagaster necrorhizus TaxID=856835 RepID=A0A9P7VHP6_9AGAR|nr:glycoside hydrolase family 51 protein [Guyanagaster necrorhizus MCA 3950]KAG7440129.1 glycoside hydrolase family 51 protein [Guyanagaster necrorhizus MCA 3950]
MILVLGFILVFFGSALSQTTVSVSSTASHPIPTTLWGQMFESGDGGLYAELLQNRAFQQVDAGTSAALKAWYPVNGSLLTVITETEPVSSALPNALNMTIASGTTGPVGFGNSGYFGIKFTAGNTYNASFYYRFPESSDFIGEVDVSIQNSDGDVLASAPVLVSGAQTSWKQVFILLTPGTTPDTTDNVFVVTTDGAAASGLTVNFAMFSLFPPTFNNRSNGMRNDIAETLQAMKPSFFRFPGGNNLVYYQGSNTATRWVWNATLGPLVDRPGRLGDWGYINTDGLGLLEYLLWCEDLEMEPIMAVWAGYGLGGQSVAEDNLEPYIQSAIDQARLRLTLIYFVIGDPATNDYAARRAELGHPEPFNLTYVEIGNEVRPCVCVLYGYRWNLYVTALQSEFPDLHFIATTYAFNPILDPTPTEYDLHVYQSSTWMSENSFYYDVFQRNGTKYFEGEYATTTNDQGSTLQYSTVEAATADAVFMTGLERNSDIVFAASYAPLLQHPNLVVFDAGAVYPSVSYYVQQLFSLYRGDEYIPSTLPTSNGNVFWSVVRKTSVTPNELIIKANPLQVINRNVNTTDVTFELPFNVSDTATAMVLTGEKTSANLPSDPDLVLPRTSSISTGSIFDYSAPGFSVNVLVLDIE